MVLQRPSAVIGDEQGRLFVSDTSRQAVFVFDEKAGELQVWERAEGLRELRRARRAWRWRRRAGCSSPTPNWASSCGSMRRASRARSIGRGLLQRPTGLARDAASGLLFVADTYAHDIKVFDANGALVRVIGRRGDGDGEFNFPTHLALGATASST